MCPDDSVTKGLAETVEGNNGDELSRVDVIFILVLLGIVSSGIAPAATHVMRFASGFEGHTFLSRWVFRLWLAVFIAATAAAFLGSYQVIRTARIDNPPIRFFVLASAVFIGTAEWRVALTPSFSVYLTLGSPKIDVGLNVVGVALYIWFASLSARARSARSAARVRRLMQG